MRRLNFALFILGLTAIFCITMLPACSKKQYTVKFILFDLSGSVNQCFETYVENKEVAQRIASQGNSGDMVVLVPFRSKGGIKETMLKYRQNKGPRDSYLREDKAQASQLVGLAIDEARNEVREDDATDLLGGLMHVVMKARELEQLSPGCIMELYVMSDGLHSRGRGLSSVFRSNTVNLYIANLREVVGQTEPLPNGVMFDRIEWYGRHDCGLEKLDYQTISFLHKAIEDLWKKYLKKNVVPEKFYFKRSY